MDGTGANAVGCLIQFKKWIKKNELSYFFPCMSLRTCACCCVQKVGGLKRRGRGGSIVESRVDRRSAAASQSASGFLRLSRAQATLTVVLLHCSGKNVGKGRGWRQGGAAPSGQAAAEAAADPAGRRLHSNGDCCGAEIAAESGDYAGTVVEQLARRRQTPRQRRWVRLAGPAVPNVCAWSEVGATRQ